MGVRLSPKDLMIVKEEQTKNYAIQKKYSTGGLGVLEEGGSGPLSEGGGQWGLTSLNGKTHSLSYLPSK